MLALLGGCHSSTAEKATDASAPPAAEKPATGSEPGEGLALKPEDAQHLGIVTTTAAAAKHVPETAGFGVVLAHETIAQGVADLASAVAVQRQSEAAFERNKRLAGTVGAMPADTLEAAERQAIVDRASLELVKRRLSSTLGQNAPWRNQTSSVELSSLASGESKLVRVTFPLGTLGESRPTKLRLGRISAAAAGKSWQSVSVWAAPADASVPGQSFFALLRGSDVSEGERLFAWAPVGAAEDGVIVPAAALVINNGKYWCYVEQKPNTFVRTEVDTSMPAAEDYFVKNGIAVGAKIVTSAAGQLLARETNPSTAAE